MDWVTQLTPPMEEVSPAKQEEQAMLQKDLTSWFYQGSKGVPLPKDKPLGRYTDVGISPTNDLKDGQATMRNSLFLQGLGDSLPPIVDETTPMSENIVDRREPDKKEQALLSSQETAQRHMNQYILAKHDEGYAATPEEIKILDQQFGASAVDDANLRRRLDPEGTKRTDEASKEFNDIADGIKPAPDNRLSQKAGIDDIVAMPHQSDLPVKARPRKEARK